MRYAITILLILSPITAFASEVFLEDLTWIETRDAIAAGSTTVLIPTGGTEQNGPQMTLGKHNYIVHETAGRIARQLGHTLIAPVIAYVPEGDIDPPTGHMRFKGTISLQRDTYHALLEDTARSLKAHGFKLICFVGDSGGNQAVQQEVASELSEEWEDIGVRVLQVDHYYNEGNGQDAWLLSKGYPLADIRGHAGLSDTSELMKAHPASVRDSLRAAHDPSQEANTGTGASSKQASAALGETLLNMKVTAAVSQIRAAQAALKN